MSDFLFDPSRIQLGDEPDEQEILSVSRLNSLVRGKLEQNFSEVRVRGEVSNLRIPASGHAYFTLKDAQAQVSAVRFRFQGLKNRQNLEEGKEIIAVGKISLYEPRGTYQIIVSSIETRGKGNLREQFEKLVEKLRDEGLFDEEHKKPLPLLPSTIGVITSKTGAAVKDITNTIWERFPGAHIVLGPVAVQGDAAAGEIAAMIDLFNEWGGADVLIVGRGGGSLEDLWAFNEEIVARAVFRSEIPVISAVGHEIDVSISDMAADVRALTPTEAGKLAVPDIRQENQSLDILLERCRNAVGNYLKSKKAEIDYFRDHRIFSVPGESIRTKKTEISDYIRRMKSAVSGRNAIEEKTLKGMADILETLNPLSILKRGFSYTEDTQGKRLTSVKKVKKGQIFRTRLQDGSFLSEVVGKGETDG